MFQVRQIKNICLVVTISVLLMGMCPTGMAADSFFASSRFYAVSQDATQTVLRATSSATTRVVAYTQETLPKHETALTPVAPSRRFNMRQEYATYLSIHEISDRLSVYSKLFGTSTGYLFAETFSNTVIISYIHHQDGAKA